MTSKNASFEYEICLITAKYEKHVASNLTDLSNFHSLEVVDRVSETQLQVGENWTKNLSEQRVQL